METSTIHSSSSGTNSQLNISQLSSSSLDVRDLETQGGSDDERQRQLPQPNRNAHDPDFAHWVNNIGDGAGPDVSLDFLQLIAESNDLINSVYPPDVLRNPLACLHRAILAPTDKQVDEYNNDLLQRVRGMQKTRFAADSIKEAPGGLENVSNSIILDSFAHQTPPDLPPYQLQIKTNAVYRLLRTLSVNRQLVKNARVVVTDVGNYIVTVRVLRDPPSLETHDEEDILPRIPFSHVLPSGHTLQRRQFPLAPAYSTTFHNCEGLTFDVVGIDLTRPGSTHEQVYTALSRVRYRAHARIRLRPGENAT